MRSGGVSCAYSAIASMRGAAFEHLEAIGRHQHSFRGLVEPVIGAADTLQHPARAFRSADIDHEIDVAPVDAEIERGGADHGAQTPRRHGVLDLAPLRHVERAVMQRDREPVLVDAPQLLEDHLGLHARVDEDERGLVAPDQRVDLVERVARRVPGPWHLRGRVEHVHDRRRAAVGDHEIGARRAAVRLRHQIAAQRLGLCDRRRQPDCHGARREAQEAREPEREQIAALGGHQRVQFVEHDAAQVLEQQRRVGRGDQQRDLLGRGEQDVGRMAALPRALRHRRVAGAGLDPHVEAHLGHRPLEVARDVDRERLERRDVERVQVAPEVRPRIGELHQRRQEARKRLAGAGRRDQQRRAPGPRAGEQLELMRARRPAAGREPAREDIGQRRVGNGFSEGHASTI